MNEEQIIKVVEWLNVAEKERLIKDGFTNSCFFNESGELQDGYKWKFKQSTGKYHKLNCGTSGAFMVEIETGEIFNIKAYGVPDKNKKIKADLGNIKDVNTLEQARVLHAKQYNYLR